MKRAARPYALPPIVEAGVTLTLSSSEAPPVDALARRFDALFPGWEADNVFDMEGTLVPLSSAVESPLSQDHQLVGFQRRREAERFRLIHDEALYVRSYRSTPYTQWDEFISSAMRHLVPLVEEVPGSLVSALEVRFVNELPIPVDVDSYEIGDYVRMYVDVPGKLPQGVNRMFAQVEIPFSREGQAVQTQTTVFAGNRASSSVLVLDLEVGVSVSPRAVNDLEDNLRVLRSVKNELFEGSITDACRIQMRGARG